MQREVIVTGVKHYKGITAFDVICELDLSILLPLSKLYIFELTSLIFKTSIFN